MDCLVILLSTLLVLCEGFNIKTRQLCCNLGTNYSSNGQGCKTFKPPIPGVSIEDERPCLNTVDFCCKKELRVTQCNSGKEDAKSSSCVEEEGDRKDCCGACRMGIEAKKSGDLCIDSIGLGSPYSEAFISCCEEASFKQDTVLNTSTTLKPLLGTETTNSAESSKYSKQVDDVAFYPGLSEENVCETGEFCAQLCEPTGKTFKCNCFPGYELMKDGVSCKPLKRAKGSRCEQNNPCDHDCIDTGTSIECSCRRGYELAADKKSCKDIDECALGIHECEPREECENDEGTYFCFITELDGEEEGGKCPVGHKFNAENSVCDDVNECEVPLVCPPPKVCKNSIGSFLCEGPDCPPGFHFKASIEVCADIDECITGDNDCNKDSQLCVNTKGNYTCVDKASRKACPAGFKKNDETLLCEDINECEDDLKVCLRNEKCINEEGGYKCLDVNSGKNEINNNLVNNVPSTTPKISGPPSCPRGFKYNLTQNTCDDINECQLRMDNCSPMHRCDNTVGSFYCTRTVSCGTGYTLNSANDLCEDDDECALGTHNCYEIGPNYKCKNQMGTYRCELIRPTYRPIPITSSSTTLIPSSPSITFPRSTTTKKTSTSIITTPSTPTSSVALPTNTLRPIPITNVWGEPFYSNNRKPWWSYRPPSQTPRYVFTSRVTDKLMPSYITEKTYQPYNPYLLIPTRKSTTSLPIINGMLKKCLPGYRMNSKGDCEDINECESNPCPRGSKCLNFNGRFECSSPLHCKIGYEANEASDECIDVDECAKGTHNCSKSQTCKNGLGYYTCECPLGHHLNRLTQTCEDLDECKFYRDVSFHKGDRMEVLEESDDDWLFVEHLTTGKKVFVAGNFVAPELCVESEDWFFENTSHKEAVKLLLGEDSPVGTFLIRPSEHNPNGYSLLVKDWEVDRGYHVKHYKIKPLDNGGFYICTNKTYDSLSELVLEHNGKGKPLSPCGNYAHCTNTIGSYHCSCLPGYKMNQNFCDDIDECQDTPEVCEHKCVNSYGSYRCACKAGYSLNYDNRTCTDIDECEKFKDRKLCIGKCVNVPGSYSCECPKGYKLGTDKRVCIDIDECQHNVCAPQDACVNTRGGYKCYPITCSPHYVKDPNHKARCKRLTCDPRDNECLLMPEQYSYQYMALVSNLPLNEEGIPMFKIKGPDMSAARADFSLKLIEVNCPPGLERVDESYIRKIQHENNLMELNLVKSIQGPQEVKLQVEMRLFLGNNLIGSVVVYIIIVVSEYPF